MSRKVQKENLEYSGPIALLAALGIFALLLILKLGLTIALIGAVALFLVVKPLVKFRKKSVAPTPAKHYAEKMIREMMEPAREQYRKLRSLELKLKDPELRDAAGRLNILVNEILEDVERDPRDIEPARPFFNRYLESQTRILESYTEIESRQNEAAQKNKERVLASLKAMEQAYSTLRKKLLEKEILSLETEMAVLNKALKREKS